MAASGTRRPYGRPHWNYRVMAFERLGEETWLAVHEVHYDPQGRPLGYSAEPARVAGETAHQLVLVLDRMHRAMGEPVLRDTDFARRPGA